MIMTTEKILNEVAGEHSFSLATSNPWAYKCDRRVHTVSGIYSAIGAGSETDFPSTSMRHSVGWYTQRALTKLPIVPSTYAPVELNGRLRWAFLDNHASGNIMALEMALKMGLAIKGDEVPFKMIDSSVELSLGHVWADCSLANAGNPKRCKFHVFSTTIRPLIIGGPFLYETGILKAPSTTITDNLTFDTKLQPTLQQAEEIYQYSLYLVNVELVNLGKRATCLAVADMGANTELMSFSFACQNGFPIQNQQRHHPMIRMGNGKHFRSRGSVQATISLISNQEQPHNPQRCRFTVVEKLPCGIILSRDFINSQNLFNLPELLLYHHVSIINQHACFCAFNFPEILLPYVRGIFHGRYPHQKDFKNAVRKAKMAHDLIEKSEIANSDGDIRRKEKLLNEARNESMEMRMNLREATPTYGQFSNQAYAELSALTEFASDLYRELDEKGFGL